MREQRIILEPFELLDILQCSGKVCADCHGYMFVKGHIAQEKEEEYLQMLLSEIWVSVKVCDEGGKTDVLFSGIVTEGYIEVENGLKALKLIIKTGSFLMDLEEHTRSFQDSETLYSVRL